MDRGTDAGYFEDTLLSTRCQRTENQDENFRNKKKLHKNEYRLRCKRKFSLRIPYLRINPNPFGIAFLILVIFSLGIGPHRNSNFLISCFPIHIRHQNHRLLYPTFNHSSKSEQFLISGNADNSKIINDNYFNSSNDVSQKFDKINNKVIVNTDFPLRDRVGNIYENNPWSSEMFLSPSKFLKRPGRSSKPIINSRETDPFLRDNAVSRHENFGFSGPSSFSKSSLIQPPCSHVGDETNEVSARAYLAEAVFEGKVRSKSTVRDPGGKYGVTFVVQHVHKDQSNGQNALRPRSQVRLYFKQKLPTIKPTLHCIQRYNYTKKAGELTKANIKKGRRYIVFVNGIGPHNYTIVGEPAPKTKKNIQAIRSVLCKNCVRAVGVSGLKNDSLKIGQKLNLVCRSRGNPLPAIQWFKDGSPIVVNSRMRIQYKKKRSLLVIPEVRNSDSGTYECRGLGVQSIHTVQSLATINVQSRFENVTALWPLAGRPCPTNLVYCLNGGTCTYYETIGELTCQCAEGFNGGRCENKDVVNSNSTYDPITCFDGVTPSYPCVTVHKPLSKIDYLI